MEVNHTKSNFSLIEDDKEIKVSISKKVGNNTVVEFTSYNVNYQLVVETGEFKELFNIMNQVKDMLWIEWNTIIK
tara:strand:+ start:52 stop:276 length:225 start_codon:yes stop_codon:yes gene_type:complete